ncbi:hypothetical protein RRF57_007971 [Xylaria bambusicola]|uniref:Uncharacterized protein n=1 Tax=Xylaria bambusicola TaxID=326684 RepID=A0AAN7Z7W4_9PEZI
MLLNKSENSKMLNSSLGALVLSTEDNRRMNGHHSDLSLSYHRKIPSSLLPNKEMNHDEDFEVEERPCQVAAETNGYCSTFSHGNFDATSPSFTADPMPDSPMLATTTVGETILNHQLLAWSARDENALKRVHQQYTKFYNSQIRGSVPHSSQLAYTLVKRRSRMT